MKAALVLIAAAVVLVALALTPLPIPPYEDFQIIYHADLGVLRGIPVYDHAGQVDMIAQFAHVSPDQVYVVPFPYPPWYALVTLWLALLPIDLAARLWFGLNLLMLAGSLWLLTEGMRSTKRALLSVAATLFVPVLGSLLVGQYVFPVLLGAALMIHALKHGKAILAALAAALLTFKPHLGLIIILIAICYLLLRDRTLAKRAIAAMAGTGLALFAAGFAVSPAWPIEYWRSLTGFAGVSQCHQCTSLAMLAAGIIGLGFRQAAIIAAVLLAAAVFWLARGWAWLTGEPTRLMAAATIITLLVSPYLQNYDYVLLLVPLIAVAAQARGMDWGWLALAYLVPLIGLGLSGYVGGVTLVAPTLIVLTLLWRGRRRETLRRLPSLP